MFNGMLWHMKNRNHKVKTEDEEPENGLDYGSAICCNGNVEKETKDWAQKNWDGRWGAFPGKTRVRDVNGYYRGKLLLTSWFVNKNLNWWPGEIDICETDKVSCRQNTHQQRLEAQRWRVIIIEMSFQGSVPSVLLVILYFWKLVHLFKWYISWTKNQRVLNLENAVFRMRFEFEPTRQRIFTPLQNIENGWKIIVGCEFSKQFVSLISAVTFSDLLNHQWKRLTFVSYFFIFGCVDVIDQKWSERAG